MLSVEHSREPIVEIDSGGTRSAASGRSNYSVVTSSAVVKQEEGILLSSSCPHQTTDAIGKSSLNTTQQQQHSVMGLCDNNNSSSYNEAAKTTSVSGGSRKGSISNITTNGFVGLPAKPDDELNLNAESFISENATISFLPSVDADNSDPIPLRKPTESLNKQSLPQRASLTSNRSEDLSVHENDVEKGMDEFTKVMNQIIKREEGVSHQMRRNSSSASLCQLSDLPQIPTTSATGNNTNGSSSSPPPYPGTSSLSTSTIKQAAQQLASTKNKYQHMMANMEHVSQPPTPVGVVESNWQQQQQQLLAAKQQQQQMILQQQHQQHYHGSHPTKPTTMQPRKPQQQQQQYDFMKSASPNVTIVSRDPYYSATAMNMPQQQQSQHAMLHQAMTINQHQPMMHLNTAPVQTMGQPTQMPQQSLATMSRNQPQIYAPLPSVDPYMGTNIEHATMTTRSGSIPYGGPIDVHMYHQQQRRHSMPPQLPTQQAQWPGTAMQQQHQDLIFENFCSPGMESHQQHSMAGHKRGQSYLPPQVAAAKRNSIQHSTVLSHTMTPAAYQHQQQHGTLVNGELNQAFHNPINDPLMHFDSRNDLFNAPL